MPDANPVSETSLSGASPLKTAASVSVQSHQSAEDQQALLQLAADILQDPLAVQALCDRIYTLLQQDLQHQRERSRGYGTRRRSL